MEIEKKRPEDMVRLSDKAIEEISTVYSNFYEWRNQRDGAQKQFQGKTFEQFLTTSRELFWNSTITNSEDLKELGLEFALPFIRKEVMEFVGRIISLNISPAISGEGVDQYGIKVLQSIYKKWRFKSNDRTEKFWTVLYGIMNGTVATYVGFDGGTSTKRFLDMYDKATSSFTMTTKDLKMWNDVIEEVVPIEEIYLSKIWERNIQRQGKLIRKQEVVQADFDKEFPKDKFPMSAFVTPGNRIAEDSLFFKLLEGTGITTTNKIQILKEYDIDNDKYKVMANGIWINKLGVDTVMPIPFSHKMMPFTWSQLYQPIDEKWAYGMSLPFMEKDPAKLLNLSYCVTPDTKILTRDLRWVRADSLQVGDKIVGFEEFGKKKDNGKVCPRNFEEATVVGTGRRLANVYQIVLKDGTKLNSTGEHRWLVKNRSSHGSIWMTTQEIYEYVVQNKNDKRLGKIELPKFFDVVEPVDSSDWGYLSGLYDGEGCLDTGSSGQTGKLPKGMTLCISQQDNCVLEKAKKILDKFSIEYTVHRREPQGEGKEPTYSLNLRGGRKALMNVLMSSYPERIINERWMKKDLSELKLNSFEYVGIVSVASATEKEIITLESSSKTYIAEGFGAHNTMLIESELRAIDRPYLSSDIEAPSIVFGEKRVIPVTDVNAYKPIEVVEPSGQFFNMMNSLQGTMSSQAQGGSSDIIPSRQPKAAREIIAMETMKQQALGSTMTMYYNMVFQEIMLVLKTALQFYGSGKFDETGVYRSMTIPNSPLIKGGMGQTEIRVVDKVRDAMVLFMEDVQKSIKNGRPTETIEVSPEFLNNLTFFIEKITLEPEKSSETERAMWNEQVMTPLMNLWIPLKIADPVKAFLRWAEKNGEHPADLVANQNLASVMNAWNNFKPAEVAPTGGGQGATGGAVQSVRGTMTGGQSNGGMGSFYGQPKE